MLCELRIKNLALIESLHLRFEPENPAGSLIVMTGETGAGKSVMLRAIQLLSGKRAAADWVRRGEELCEVEALFEIEPAHTSLLTRLEEGGFGQESEVVIKRILGANGRSRFYVNGSLASAKVVAELTGEMFDVASQHDQQHLLRVGIHLDLLDTIGDLWPERVTFGENYRHWQRKKIELSTLLQREQEKEQRRDFLQFQVGEIRDAAPQLREDEELNAEKKRLKSVQTLIDLSQESYRLLSGELLDGLGQLRQNVTQLATLDEKAEKFAEEISDYTFQAEDYIEKIRHYRDSLETSPFRLEQISERLDLLSQLKRKYGETIAHILAFAAEGERELEQLENMEKEISTLRQEVELLQNALYTAGNALSAKRRKTAAHFEQAMMAELASLSFSQPVFAVDFSELPTDREAVLAQAGTSGWDTVEFFFSANLGEEPKPLAKIASGGELSRLLLAMKCLLAKKDMVETVIFDEVDTGIGGEAAEAVARKVQELAAHHQVFCITHLPQIAARGEMHLQVAKSVQDSRTHTRVTVLTEEERVQELVRMLAGDSATLQTERWARELLRSGKGRKNGENHHG